MGLLARLALGMVLGVCLGIVGNISGWATAFSVPEGLAGVPFMALLTGTGAGLGGYLGWRIDLDNNPGGPVAVLLPLALACGLAGAWLGFMYGSTDEGTRVWRYPVTQATILGAAAGANLGLLAWNTLRRLRTRQPAASTQSSEYFQALKAMRKDASRPAAEQHERGE